MMAREAFSNAEGSDESPATACFTPASRFSIGSCRPIIPVEQTMICSGLQPSAAAAVAAVRRTFSSPTAPVAALALPELATTARMDSEGTR